jgi:hypothetical protein
MRGGVLIEAIQRAGVGTVGLGDDCHGQTNAGTAHLQGPHPISCKGLMSGLVGRWFFIRPNGDGLANRRAEYAETEYELR